MKLLYLSIILFIIYLPIFIYSILYYQYHYSAKQVKLYNKLNINQLDYIDFDYLNKNYPEEEIYITKTSGWPHIHRKVKLKEYFNTYIKDPNWYFATEDEYDFLKQISLKDDIISIFSNIFDISNNVSNEDYKDLSLWVGGKNSITAWHTDIEDTNFLYIIKGKKKVRVVDQKYHDKMYAKNEYYEGALWSDIDFKHPDYKKFPSYKNLPIQTYILNPGDAIYIPRNHWHCIENLEDTIAMSYKIFKNPSYKLFVQIPEMIRYYYYLYNINGFFK